jgi:hypothetical protein
MRTEIDQNCNGTEIFWGEIAPCEHLVQIYADDEVFLDSLQEFVAGGLQAGDGVIVIATTAHLNALEDRLVAHGLDVDTARSQDQYIPLDAEETLSKFMVGGWPDDELFAQVVTGLLARARGNGRRVRAFGEMVALLWARGHSGATVRLEHVWHSFCREEAFSLFCAYPRIGFTQDAHESMREICATHSKVIAGDHTA